MTYHLPREQIAKYPSEPRDAARLLVLNRGIGQLTHRIFRDLPEYLRPEDCLVLNDTKVLPARLLGRKADTGAGVELLLLKPKGDSVYRCLGQPAKRLKPGSRLLFNHGSFQAEVLFWEGGECIVRFDGDEVDQVLLRLAEVPLPPYIDRPVEPRDAQWYQTVYAQRPGAVAAPTAGLHFTPELLDRIRRQGVRVAFVTLHVGWGTFKLVGAEELQSGRLHPEWFRIPPETAQVIGQTRAAGGRVVAVGTTVVRALESWVKICRGQTPSGPFWLGAAEGTTNLFIRPPFEFKVIDAMITNFHLPGTSLLYLMAAFAGKERVQAAYEEAIRQRYRFYSYGDAMLMV